MTTGSRAVAAHYGEHRGLFSTLSMCFYVSDIETESVCICTTMFVPFNACRGALVTPCNRQLLQGQIKPRIEAEQLLLVA